jgi:hypothetical protein
MLSHQKNNNFFLTKIKACSEKSIVAGRTNSRKVSIYTVKSRKIESYPFMIFIGIAKKVTRSNLSYKLQPYYGI